jgi:disulfide bond formation protein DsbB
LIDRSPVITASGAPPVAGGTAGPLPPEASPPVLAPASRAGRPPCPTPARHARRGAAATTRARGRLGVLLGAARAGPRGLLDGAGREGQADDQRAAGGAQVVLHPVEVIPERKTAQAIAAQRRGLAPGAGFVTEPGEPMPSDASPPASPRSHVFAYAAWLIALAAMLGSLFFGEVMKLPPCTLCWYQRICLFPLTLVIAAGIVLRDRNVVAYALPLAVVGLGISTYHNLLYYGVIPETLSPCTQAVSCSSRQLELLGFLTIPNMALLAFASILVTLLAHRKTQRRA